MSEPEAVEVKPKKERKKFKLPDDYDPDKYIEEHPELTATPYKPRQRGKYNIHWKRETQEKILAALRAGNTRQDAFLWSGIDGRTFYEWLDDVDDFSQEVIQAESHAKVKMVTTITQAAQAGSWQAALAWLERRYPREWGKVDQMEVGLRAMTQDELKDFIAQRLGLSNAIGATSVRENDPYSRAIDPIVIDQEE